MFQKPVWTGPKGLSRQEQREQQPTIQQPQTSTTQTPLYPLLHLLGLPVEMKQVKDK